MRQPRAGRLELVKGTWLGSGGEGPGIVDRGVEEARCLTGDGWLVGG